MQQFEQLQVAAEDKFDEDGVAAGMDLFEEDWNLSQFWYSEETSKTLAEELLRGATPETTIAVVSAPSVYAAIKKMGKLPTKEIYLLEYDDRFKILAGAYFVHYDFRRPLELPKKLHHAIDRVLVDPPFLSDECQTKAAVSVRWMLRKSEDRTDQHRTIVSTGERMASTIAKVYPDTSMTDFFPQHANGLSNEFLCYASFDCEKWKRIDASMT